MKLPLSSRYDPKATDGDGDQIVQDATPWERPAAINLINLDSSAASLTELTGVSESPIGALPQISGSRSTTDGGSVEPNTRTGPISLPTNEFGETEEVLEREFITADKLWKKRKRARNPKAWIYPDGRVYPVHWAHSSEHDYDAAFDAGLIRVDIWRNDNKIHDLYLESRGPRPNKKQLAAVSQIFESLATDNESNEVPSVVWQYNKYRSTIEHKGTYDDLLKRLDNLVFDGESNNDDPPSGSKSSTSKPMLIDFSVPVQFGDKKIVSYGRLDDSQPRPFTQSVLDTMKRLGAVNMDRRALNGLDVVAVPNLALFPEYSIITNIPIEGKQKTISSAIASIMPTNAGKYVTVFSIHIPNDIAESIIATGKAPRSILEKLRKTEGREIDRKDAAIAFQHLGIPGIKMKLNDFAQKIMSLNFPSHAIPLIVSFVDDIHGENESKVAGTISLARSITVWDNPDAKDMITHLHVLTHEVGHLLDNIPRGYSTLTDDWQTLLQQDKMPLYFSESKAYSEAMMRDFLLNQARQLSASDLEQILVNTITPEMTNITDYASSHDKQNIRFSEDFAESFSLFVISELTGLLGNMRTGDRRKYDFASIFPYRDTFFRGVLSSFGISDISNPSGSKSTTRPHLVSPRINQKTPDFPLVNYGKWSTRAPVIGPERILPSLFIDEETTSKALDAMRLLRKKPSLQGPVSHWMMGGITTLGTDNSVINYDNAFKALDHILDIAPPIDIGTMFRAVDFQEDFSAISKISRGRTIMFRGASVSFSPSDAFDQSDRASQISGIPSNKSSAQRVLFTIPRTARGVIYDDSSIDVEKWGKSPTDAIIRGRFSVSSVRKKDGFTLVELSEINEFENGANPFMYISLDRAAKAGDIISHNERLYPVGKNPIIFSSPIDEDNESAAMLDEKTQTSGKYFFEVEPGPVVSLPGHDSGTGEIAKSSTSKIVASYEVGELGDAVSFSSRGTPVGSKSRTKSAISTKFLGDDVFIETDSKNRDRMFDLFKNLGLDYETVKQHVRDVLQARREEVGDRQFKKEMKIASQWYPRVRKGLIGLTREINNFEEMGGRRKYDDAEIFAMMAALSPQERVKSNIEKVKNIALSIALDKEFTLTIPDGGLKYSGVSKEGQEKIEEVKQWLNAMSGQSFRPSTFIQQFMEQFGSDARSLALDSLARIHPTLFAQKSALGIANVVKALMIGYRVDTIDNILSGPKVRSFYLNFLNPKENNVTIDTWMYLLMAPSSQIFSYRYGGINHTGTLMELRKKLGKNFSTQTIFQGNQIDGISIGVYAVFAQILRDLTVEFGSDFKDLNPATLQALLWEIARIKLGGYRPTDFSEVAKALEITSDDIEYSGLTPKGRKRK